MIAFYIQVIIIRNCLDVNYVQGVAKAIFHITNIFIGMESDWLHIPVVVVHGETFRLKYGDLV